jgi:hypothetical protein
MPDDIPPTGGSGRRNPGLEARVAVLEAAVDDIRSDLKAIRVDLARMDGKLSNVPTTFQLVFMQAAIIVAVFGGAIGLAFALLKFASGH